MDQQEPEEAEERWEMFWVLEKVKVRGEASDWKEKQRQWCVEEARRELEDWETIFKLHSSSTSPSQEAGGGWLIKMWGSIEAQKAEKQIK